MKPNLSLAVDSNYARRGIMWRCHKDCISTDSIHVYTGSGLNVIQVNVSIFCNQVDDIIFLTNLHIPINQNNYFYSVQMLYSYMQYTVVSEIWPDQVELSISYACVLRFLFCHMKSRTTY